MNKIELSNGKRTLYLNCSWDEIFGIVARNGWINGGKNTADIHILNCDTLPLGGTGGTYKENNDG